jgi:AraC-like DNA-binding protein
MRAPIGLRVEREPVAFIRHGGGADGIQRLEARFSGQPFAPHRHDHYAIGVTLGGVQTFRYRGAQRYCRAGEGHVLHPDEVHDGAAATDEGFAYRILYIDPAHIRDAIGHRALPFVANPVIGREHMRQLTAMAFADIDDCLDEIGRVDLTVEVAGLLERHAKPSSRPCTLALDRLRRVREALAWNPAQRLSARELERVAGLDRWTIARQFRAAFGTSPTRFRTMRQLELSREMMLSGHSLASAASAAGFADQSHFTRKFKRAYGMTPANWLASTHAARAPARAASQRQR